MDNGIYPKGRWKPLPKKEDIYKGKPGPASIAWWTATMALCMGGMVVAGLLYRRGKEVR